MRWASFHDKVRQVSGNRLQRTIGRMLGENTLRYQVARLFGRPILQMVRTVKSQQHVPVRHGLANGSTIFPLNYRPRSGTRVITNSISEQHILNVAVVSVNETNDSPNSFIDSLNETISATKATWMLLVDETVSSIEQTETLAVLLSRAQDDDDVVFADEAGINPLAPIFKSPAVGPHTLLSYNVVGRPALLRVATLRKVDGFSLDAGWALEHDVYLRLSEHRARFHHVPMVLPGGRPAIAFSGTHIDNDSCRVVQAAFNRRKWRGTVASGSQGGSVHWTLMAPSPEPTIDIVIPTRDRVDLVRQCIEAIEAKTTYSNFDIIILDNDSKDRETLDYFATTKYRVVACPGPFNYARIVNRGIDHSSADFIVTLNNDTILVTPDWLERMVSLASLPDVGIVGACLLDQDGGREHESIVIAPYPQHLRSDSNYPHLDQFIEATRDVAAVTGAVQMVHREFWESLNGMDEELKVVLNDVDICLRSQIAGRYVVYTPDVKLYHHVSSSRGTLDPLDDRNRFIRRWDIFGTFQDPYFPETLQLLGETIYYFPHKQLPES